MAVDYRPGGPGDPIAIAHGDVVLLVAADVARVPDLFEAVRGGSVAAVVDALAAGGIARTPDFALLAWRPDGLVAVVRGAFQIEVHADAGSRTIAGGGVATWSEHDVAGARSAAVTRGEHGDATEALPLGSGAVHALALDATRADAAADAGPAERDAVPPTGRATAVASADTVKLGAFEPEPESAAASSPATPHADDATIVMATGPAARRQARLHDGETILDSDLARLRAARAAAVGRPEDTDPGEPAPPSAPAPAEPEPAPPRRPHLEFSSGAVAQLATPVIVGRAPSVSQASGANLPMLVRIADDEDISRNHVRVEVEGDTVVVTDLGSRNGTIVRMPGRAAQRLRSAEPTPVIVGTVIDLGGGTTIAVVDG